MQSVISKVASEIRDGRPARLFKSYSPEYRDGCQMRDFIEVSDACAVVNHLAAGSAPSGLYNVGTGTARSFDDFASDAYRAAGHEPAIEYIDMPEALRARYQYFTQAETRKLRASGILLPFVALEDSVTRYVQEYLLRDDPYR